MALKKSISKTEYLYARVKRVNYEKNQAHGIFLHIEKRLVETDEVILVDEMLIRPLQIEEQQKNFNLQVLQQMDNDVIKSCYEYSKSFVPFFIGWEDC